MPPDSLPLMTLREPVPSARMEDMRRHDARYKKFFSFPELPEIENLEEAHTMLSKTVVEWTRQWRQEGLEEALKKGLEKG